MAPGEEKDLVEHSLDPLKDDHVLAEGGEQSVRVGLGPTCLSTWISHLPNPITRTLREVRTNSFTDWHKSWPSNGRASDARNLITPLLVGCFLL
jgi:hypothetical protein